MNKDYSKECTHDDDNDKRCWNCIHFIFPIGCMLDKDAEELPTTDEE